MTECLSFTFSLLLIKIPWWSFAKDIRRIWHQRSVWGVMARYPCNHIDKLCKFYIIHLAWKKFPPRLLDNCMADDSHLEKALKCISNAGVDIGQGRFDAVFHNYSFSWNTHRLKVCLTFLRNSNNGNLTAFWNAYIVMMEVVLQLIWASRERDSMLHLNSNRAVTPGLSCI